MIIKILAFIVCLIPITFTALFFGNASRKGVQIIIKRPGISLVFFVIAVAYLLCHLTAN
ncbi:hypothetical protein Solca_0870 [Solitalea canadensis DSM 3403]|uniref:Uncharacterized protein n=1 Tax=Solitalea canadensis (strain ATCC 29591 / DSM 3403 / JCM 21819 / LMG 8368 / NBRC 15130 / NCIMB 12057 / USAM 9D) TaxID=929556 RepID=H8KPT7_SOLCM|nr:hypothetical protein Solca_0870 [Solitalea canadensis DSM 3403]